MSDGSDSDGDYYSANFKRFKEKRQKNALNNSHTSSQVQSIPIVTVEKQKVEPKKRKKDVRKGDLSPILNKTNDEPSVCEPEIDPEIEALFDSPAITLKSPPRKTISETDRMPILEEIVVLDTNEDTSCLSIQSEILTDSSVSIPSCWVHFKNIFTCDKVVIMCEMDRTFSSIIQENASRIGVDPDKFLLMGTDRRFYPNESPQSVGFFPDTVYSLDICEDGSATGEVITIKWQLKGKKPIQANILIKQKFSILKSNLCKEHNLDPNKTCLVFDADKLDENSCADDEGIESGDCIDVYLN